MLNIPKIIKSLKTVNPIRINGQVKRVIGLVIESLGPNVSVGELCLVYGHIDQDPVYAEVVGFREDSVLLMPLGEMKGIKPGSQVVATHSVFKTKVGYSLLGRVLDGLGNPIDGKGPIKSQEKLPVHNEPPSPFERERIKEKLITGIRAIDNVITFGKGQRVGIFAGSGVGKSVLMGMIARNTEADINVIALIGERGREVRDFIEKDLGQEGLKRSVIIVATSDKPALVRVTGAYLATAVAEYFRDEGKNVMLMMDSVTRFAMAQREVGLTIGEPPTTKGYTPSVFAVLPKLLERAGMSTKGSITGLYTVLVEGDDMNEPIADAARSILDGHVVLSRKLASKGHYPAIDTLESVSRVMIDVIDQEHRYAAYKLKDLLSTYNEAEDLINIGAYIEGSNPKIDESLKKIDQITDFLRQGIEETNNFNQSLNQMKNIVNS